MSELSSLGLNKVKALIEIYTRISASYSNLSALQIAFLESVMCLVECEASSILLVDSQNDCLRFSVALGPLGAKVKDIPVNKNSIAGWVAEHTEPLIVNDVASDSRFNSEVQTRTDYITHTMIAVPMYVDGKCAGVIEVINKAGGKPFNQEDLSLMELLGKQAGVMFRMADVLRDTKEHVTELENAVGRGKKSEYHAFIAESPLIKDLMKVIDEVAKTNSSVLIFGESGVGKELFAEQLHMRSRRMGKPFVRVSCAALSPSLLESELFGHVKGAYTNAVSAQKGRFEMADGGTLFLDEIGEMPLNLQAKLLRVIQERRFERVGSSETISVDVRIIAATNRNLEEMVKAKQFRDDLYYRLNVLPLNIPPLRQRKEDIKPLALFFLERYSSEMKKTFTGFSPAAFDALNTYRWPGNVRELENTIERACILGQNQEIQVGDLRLPLTAEKSEAVDIVNTIEEIARRDDRSLKTAMTAFKRQYVRHILEEANWNQTEAAKILDVQRTYVSRLIMELQIRK